MPTTYRHNASYGAEMTVSCGTCNETMTILGAYRSSILDGSETASDGRTASEVFRFIPGRGRYTTSCRQCERTARQRSGRSASRRSRAVRAILGRNESRRFGVELELTFPSGVTRSTITNALSLAGCSARWGVKSDCSIRAGARRTGWEVVSPPLSGEAGLEEIRTATRVLRELGADVNNSTGTHVHHDISDMDVDSVKRFYSSWFNNQHLTDGLVAPSRRGSAGPTYCQPLDDSDVVRMNNCRTLDDIRGLYLSRYKTVNITSYARYGTVEIRQHQGTCNAEKIVTWIKLGQALLDEARNSSAPAPRMNSVVERLSRLGDLLDETAATFAIGRAVQFNAAPVTAQVAA